jgi:hypothetical protein
MWGGYHRTSFEEKGLLLLLLRSRERACRGVGTPMTAVLAKAVRRRGPGLDA